jgi:hypothetical protein
MTMDARLEEADNDSEYSFGKPCRVSQDRLDWLQPHDDS